MDNFQKALNKLPSSVGFDPFEHNTIDDLCWICLHELDLVAEREYWHPISERKKLLKFIETFAGDCKKDYTNEAREIFNQSLNVTKRDCYTDD